MPFDEGFDAVYKDFIKPVMEKMGFEVDRAADIESQQNILRDIIDGITKSDLIIADLTGANPNVFYELGLAHALRKPVILVTQSIEEVPFDLKSYRLLEYSTHFTEIRKAEGQLTKYAKGFVEKDIRFGSPVTDFYRDSTESNQDTRNTPNNAVGEDERGYIDHLIDINDGYSHIAKITEGITKDLQNLNYSIGNATDEITQISANANASSPVAARRVLRRLADRIGSFNSKLNQANIEYATIAEKTENSLEFVVSYRLEQSEVVDDQVDELISSLRTLQSSVIESRDSQLGLVRIMDELPRIERRLNREVARWIKEGRVMARNLDKTIASISRALEKYD